MNDKTNTRKPTLATRLSIGAAVIALLASSYFLLERSRAPAVALLPEKITIALPTLHHATLVHLAAEAW